MIARSRVLLVVITSLSAGCDGAIGDASSPGGGLPGGGAGGPGGASCAVAGAIDPGPSPLRRLTRRELDHTLRDLVGDDTRPADRLPAEEENLGFDNGTGTLGVSPVLAEQYLYLAEDVAGRAVASIGALVPCDPVAGGESACAAQFIETFGTRALRRPLLDEDRARYAALFESGRADGGFASGIELVIEAMLVSPSFLYRVEIGGADPVTPGVVALGPYEIASRLSYLVWGSMPDETLFAAARAGELATREQIAAQARRMLDDPRARDVVAEFHAQWLRLDEIDRLEKDPAVYPELTPDVRALFAEEARTFIERTVFEGPGDLDTLLTAPYSYMNADLAAFYGVPGPAGDAFERVDLDPARHAGILTDGGLLAVLAKRNQTSPIARGVFVREHLFCQTLPTPPPDVNTSLPPPEPGLTTRERFAAHTSDPSCAACHVLIDPVGFGLESYDGIGRWRDEDGGEPVDASGMLTGTDVDGAFNGAVELSHKLASSATVHECAVRQWFRFAHGRAETASDGCAIRQLDGAFAAAGYDIRELIVALTQSDAFMYRRAAEEGSP